MAEFIGLYSVCLRLRVVRLAHESRVCALLQVGNFEKALDRLCHWATNFTMTKFGPNLNTLTGRRKAMSENAWLLESQISWLWMLYYVMSTYYHCQGNAKSETNREYLPTESTEFDRVFCNG
jgi:hypothetical protein